MKKSKSVGPSIKSKPKNEPINYKKMGIRKIGNNDLCDCGSGRKFKKCCKNKEEEVEIYKSITKNN